MPKVDVPFADSSIDTNRPVDSGMNILMLIVGMGVFFMAASYGRSLGNWLTGLTDNLVGTNASGDNNPVLGSLE